MPRMQRLARSPYLIGKYPHPQSRRGECDHASTRKVTGPKKKTKENHSQNKEPKQERTRHDEDKRIGKKKHGNNKAKARNARANDEVDRSDRGRVTHADISE